MSRINNILKNEKYRNYLDRLMCFEKDRKFCHHDIEHFLGVARIMMIKNQEENFNIDKDVIYAIALLHDIGRVLQYEKGINHSKASAEIAKEILEKCQYSSNEIEIITSAISKHNIANDDNYINNLLKYADRISRNCFICPAFDDCNWDDLKKNKGVTL
ncbi:MAG TPA: hypothetical protein DIC60_07340 [Lachnospiraceae bacterium]|nr:hypothetical protein [Lachnospiraceae bacterium]